MGDHGIDGGEAILQACRDLGVDYVVSSPGSDWGPVWEALSRQQAAGAPGPAYLNCWHELLAVDVALGYAAITGRLQAVLLHAGVGLMQGSMGLYGARLAETPMLVMSGESTSFGDRPDFDPGPQWYNNHNIAGGLATLVHPIVKWAHQAGSAANLYEMVLRAGEIALAGPAGPTYLDVPLELMLEPWPAPQRTRAVPPTPKVRPSVEDLDAIAKRVLAAARPVIVSGSAGRTREGYEALVDLAESLSLPVVEAASGDVGSFPVEHPLHQGFDVREVLPDADLVLVVRCRAPWNPPHRGPQHGRVIVIDEHPFKIHMAYQNLGADAVLAGDVPSTLQLLAAALRSAAATDAAIAKRSAERRARLAELHEARCESRRRALIDARARKGIAPAVLADALAGVLPEDTAYVDETTVHLGMNRRHLEYRGPQSYFALRAGLGQGLGVALGVKLAARDRTVVSLIGDGAFLYNPTLPCLGLSRDERLPILIVVYNNRGYRAMRDSQLAYYPDGAASHGTSLGETISGIDYERMAEPFGAYGVRVETQDDLVPALRSAHAAVEDGRTAIVNVLLTE